jgi:hypothetical protein
VHSLSGALLFGVSGSVNGGQLLEVSLRHHFVRNQQFAAVESAVGAQNFDSRFVEVSACLRHVPALQQSDWLPFAHLLPWSQRKIHQASAERSVDMDQMRGVSFNPPRDFEGGGRTLHMNRLNLEVYLWLVGFNRGSFVPAAGEQKYGDAGE